MFNVYPFELVYSRTVKDGVLAGIPYRCSAGVESEIAGLKMYEKLIADNPDSLFSNMSIKSKKN